MGKIHKIKRAIKKLNDKGLLTKKGCYKISNICNLYIYERYNGSTYWSIYWNSYEKLFKKLEREYMEG